MNEFELIDHFFKKETTLREDVVFGIGDDAACLRVPPGMDLLVSTDVLVSGVHFLQEWDAYDIAWRSVMVNLSDIAAMGGEPSWISLALVLPQNDASWLQRFSEGLRAALAQYQVTLIGGDTTRGPNLVLSFTVHGFAPTGRAVRRSTAKAGDSIWLSGDIGAAALALEQPHEKELMDKLLHPVPRVDLAPLLQEYASSAIDVSDGLSADLNHICTMSQVGACLWQNALPIHPLLKQAGSEGLALALSGGDDYEICFTVSPTKLKTFQKRLDQAHLSCHHIGFIEEKPGLRLQEADGQIHSLAPLGYKHY